MPPAPVTTIRIALEDPDLGVVADHEPIRARGAAVAPDRHVAAEQRRLHPPVEVLHRGAREEDRLLDLGVPDLASLADGGVRPDVGVDQVRAGTDDGGSAHRRAFEPGARLDHHPADGLRLDELAVHARLEVVEDQPVGLEHVVEAAGVLPPPADDVRLDAHAAVDEVLDRVGDLELATAAWWIEGVNMYTPTRARSVGGLGGFSTRRTTRSPSSSATP